MLARQMHSINSDVFDSGTFCRETTYRCRSASVSYEVEVIGL